MPMPSAYLPKEKNTVRVKRNIISSKMLPLKFGRINSTFFFCLGILIFLYAGLRFVHYIEKYETYQNVVDILVSKLKNIKKIRTNYAYASNDTVQNNNVEGEKKEKQEEFFFDPLSIISPNDVKVLKTLGIRRQKLEKRELEISQRELDVAVLEKKLAKKLKALKTIGEMIKKDLKELDQQEIKKAVSLAKIYSSMKPKDAARIFEGLDMPVLLAVVSKISERKLAPIIANLSADKARDLTKKISRKSTNLSKALQDNVGNLGN